MRHVLPCAVLALAVAACSSTPRAREDANASASMVATARATCACALDEICDAVSEQCIARPVPSTGDISAEIDLLAQFDPLSTDVLARIGKAEARFSLEEPSAVPRTTRFVTAEGEDCISSEASTTPSIAGLDAGAVTFLVDGSQTRIVLDTLYVDAEYGWGYEHGGAPPPLEDGSAKYPSFFDPAYLPAGRRVQVRTGGGTDIAAHAFVTDLPAAFTITSPSVESPGATAPLGRDLTVTWSSPDPSAYMEIFVTASTPRGLAVARCKVKDDGAAVLPVAALPVTPGSIGLQLRRTTARYTRIVEDSGKIVHVFANGRLARLGAVTLVK